MKYHRLFIFITILVGWVCSLQAGDDCLALFKMAYHKMIALHERKDMHKGMYMKYHIEVTNAHDETYSDVMEMKSFKQKSKITSTKVTIYQDVATMVAIQPENKTIFITRPLPDNFRKTQMDDVLKMHDSLFQYMVLKSCVKESLDKKGKPAKKLHFEVTPANQQKLGMAALTYWINEKEVQVLKMKVVYAENVGKPLKSSTYTIDSFDGEFSQAPFEGSAANMVLTSTNKLKQNYKGYTLIDKR